MSFEEKFPKLSKYTYKCKRIDQECFLSENEEDCENSFCGNYWYSEEDVQDTCLDKQRTRKIILDFLDSSDRTWELLDLLGLGDEE